jgi:hypothetical protein
LLEQIFNFKQEACARLSRKTAGAKPCPKPSNMPTNTNTDKDKQTFYQYVLNTMSAADFNTLPVKLGVSQRMTTVRLMNPRKMKLEMIEQLAGLLEVSVQFLILEFDAGDETLSAKEYKELTKDAPNELEAKENK